MPSHCFVLVGEHAKPYERRGLIFLNSTRTLLCFTHEDVITAYDAIVVVLEASEKNEPVVLACGLLKCLGRAAWQLVALRMDSNIQPAIRTEILDHVLSTLKTAVPGIVQIRCVRAFTPFFLVEGFQLTHSVQHRDGTTEDVVVHVKMHITDLRAFRCLDKRNRESLPLLKFCYSPHCYGFCVMTSPSGRKVRCHCCVHVQNMTHTARAVAMFAGVLLSRML